MDRTNCIVQEFLVDKRSHRLDHQKLFCIESMLDEFSDEDLCPYLEPYLDYRVIKMNRCVIMELAHRKRGSPLHRLTKFEKAIAFNDIREHIFKMLVTLSFLKARVVINSSWLVAENVCFDLDSFQPRLNNFVVVDLFKSVSFSGDSDVFDLKDICGEEEKIRLDGEFYNALPF